MQHLLFLTSPLQFGPEQTGTRNFGDVTVVQHSLASRAVIAAQAMPGQCRHVTGLMVFRCGREYRLLVAPKPIFMLITEGHGQRLSCHLAEGCELSTGDADQALVVPDGVFP